MRPAVFFDRDGTLVEHVHYLNRPDQIRVLPRVPALLRGLHAAGYACVVVTNQAAIGKGLLTVDGLHEIQEELARQLAVEGAQLDGWYYCPEVRRSDDIEELEHPDRKPGPGMLLRAAAELGLDVGASWMVGDMLSDTLAGRNAGCLRTVLVSRAEGDERARLAAHASVDHVVRDVGDVLALVLAARATTPDGAREES